MPKNTENLLIVKHFDHVSWIEEYKRVILQYTVRPLSFLSIRKLIA